MNGRRRVLIVCCVMAGGGSGDCHSGAGAERRRPLRRLARREAGQRQDLHPGRPQPGCLVSDDQGRQVHCSRARRQRSDDGPCMREINLHGRTAVPGLSTITTTSCCSACGRAMIRGLRPRPRLPTSRPRSARVPHVRPGEFITAMGGWIPAQFVENRLPTLAELDAAAPQHPVLVFHTFLGPATTNTLGRNFFTGKGVAVTRPATSPRCSFGRRPECAARDPDLRRQEAGHARRAGLFGQRRRDHQCRHGRLHPAGHAAHRQIPTCSTLWRAAIRSLPTTRCSRCMTKAR